MKTSKKQIKIVLTGGPCCGKTTTLNEIKRRRHKTLDEAARLVLEEGIYHPSKGVDTFQEAILRKQLENERALEGLAFLDRSAIDGIAYSVLFTRSIPEFFNKHDFRNRYSQVFFLDRFPLQNDGVRVESSDEEAQRVHDMILQTYLHQGYSPVRVPIMPVEERVEYILGRLE
jgi:predicted ATPase